MAVLLLTWFLGYITVYSYAAGFTSALTSLHYAPPEAGVIVAVGVVGFIAGSIFTSFFAERLERHLWLPLSAVITLGGAALVAEAGTHIVASFAGSALIFVGFNMWVSPTYALSAESFPSRARTTGFGVVDGIGHLGGGIGVLVISPYIPHLPPIAALMMISGFLVLAAVVVQLAPATRGVPLERVSP
jgi:MFS family permease